MAQELYQCLSALCEMWDQYCGGPHGHECMVAGEHAADVLDHFKLLRDDNGYGGKVDWDRLKELEKQIIK